MKNLSFSWQSNICDYSIILHFFAFSYTLYSTEPIKDLLCHITHPDIPNVYYLLFRLLKNSKSRCWSFSLFARGCIGQCWFWYNQNGMHSGLLAMGLCWLKSGHGGCHIELHCRELSEYIGLCLCVTPSRPLKGSCFWSICITSQKHGCSVTFLQGVAMRNSNMLLQPVAACVLCQLSMSPWVHGTGVLLPLYWCWSTCNWPMMRTGFIVCFLFPWPNTTLQFQLNCARFNTMIFLSFHAWSGFLEYLQFS